MRPPTKLQVFGNFWTQNMLQPFITPRTLQSYLRQNIFCSPSWKWSWKNSTLRMLLRSKSRYWWIKEGPKRGIFGSFSETVGPHKSLYICQWILFWIKKSVCVILLLLLFLKKISPKILGLHCVYSAVVGVLIKIFEICGNCADCGKEL